MGSILTRIFNGVLGITFRNVIELSTAQKGFVDNTDCHVNLAITRDGINSAMDERVGGGGCCCCLSI